MTYILFKNYGDFKYRMENRIKRLSSAFKPRNAKATIASLWSAMRRPPSFVEETFYSGLFGTQNWILKNTPANMMEESELIRTETAKNSLLNPKQLNLDPILVQRTIQTIDKLLKVRGLRFSPISASAAADYLPKNTSSGFPEFEKKSNLLNLVVTQVNTMLYTDNFTIFKDLITVIIWRTQVRLTGLKFRQIYMFPYLVLVCEAMFASGLLDHMSSISSPYVYNDKFPQLAERWKSLQKYANILSLDIKGFDLSVPLELIYIYFSWQRSHIKFDTLEQAKLFENIRNYNMSCLIATSIDGKSVLFSKLCSVMSGSFNTNLMVTFVNMFIVIYHCHANNIEVNSIDLHLKGDDILVGTNSDDLLDGLVETYSKTFLMTVALDKTQVFKRRQRIYFLGYYFDDKGRYLDWKLTKLQLSISENFIPESVMPTFERLFSKLCSICFKCSDGYVFFDMYINDLLRYCNKTRMPTTFSEIFTITGEDQYAMRDFAEYRVNGWLNQ